MSLGIRLCPTRSDDIARFGDERGIPLRKAPLAVDAVRRIDALFAVERTINGLSAGDRLAVRQRESKPIVVDLENGCAPNARGCRATPRPPGRSITC